MRWFRRRRPAGGLPRGVVLGPDVRIAFREFLELGEDVRIGEGAFLQARGGISIGARTRLDPRVVILSHNHNYASPHALPYDEQEICKPVQVGCDVWVGMGAMICPGVRIGDGAVVLMGSVVTRDVTACAVVQGNPAVRVGERPAAVLERRDPRG